MLNEQTRYSRLANLTKIINTKLDLREVLQHVTTAISEEIVQCDAVGIYLPEKNGTFRGFVGKPDVINGETLDMQVIDLERDLLAKEVVETKKTIYIPDTTKDHRPDPRSMEAFKINSLLALPISYGEELFGLAFLFDYAIPMNLTPLEIQSVEAYVNMAAVAIRNAKNMEQLESMVEERTKELAAANEKVTNVIESITDGFFALNKEWKFVYINQHQYLPANRTREDVLGKNIWEVLPKSVGTVMYEEFHRAMTERIAIQFEAPSAYDDYWYEAMVYPYDEGICCLFKNVTEKRKYEEELKRLSNLDLIGQMAAGISHEIRNPMTTVRGFLQLLKQEGKYEKHDGLFELLIEELDRANSIITEFLSIGNTKTSDLQMYDLNSIIQEIAPLIEIDTRNQNKTVHFDLHDIPELLLNRNEIRQLIINLYRNGLDAMCKGQVLTIRTYKEDENCVVLAVQDQGEGIRSEIIEKIGTPFYTTKDHGTGLGLGICYAIAARHQAKIEMQTGSEGTTFFVKFSK
ncbi:ATP-binding protein [Sporosarcina sp. ACRSM]|uniref:GAF domain-containing sensor histidine kinase n=1 Tax=Sporosarcina sp. ACRSM TaxID=2918216 RepID=UPI001EF4A904|nr:GAF domain-containing sensor histidine kinase [Sporosarcina sp. ACRSM]MCG7335160.1 ATP-binding protein [Sporosarcina sp. ACRSM]